MGTYASKLPDTEDVATQCGRSRATNLTTFSPSRISSNRTPVPSGVDFCNNKEATMLTEAAVFAALRKALQDPQFVDQLSETFSKVATKLLLQQSANEPVIKQQDSPTIDHHFTIDGNRHNMIDESCEALDLIGLSDRSTIKNDKLVKSQSVTQIIDTTTPAKPGIAALRQVAASGPTFQERAGERQRFMNMRWRAARRKSGAKCDFVVGNSNGGEVAIDFAAVTTTTATAESESKKRRIYKHRQLNKEIMERQQYLDSELSRLRKQCLSQEIQLSSRRTSTRAAGSLRKQQVEKSLTTPKLTTSASRRHDSFSVGDQQQIADDDLATLALQQDPSPKSARLLLRKVTRCLSDIKEAIYLISDGLEAVDCLLSECDEGGAEIEQLKATPKPTGFGSPKQITPSPINNDSSRLSAPSSGGLCRSVPITKPHKKRDRNENADLAVAAVGYRKASASFSVSLGDKRGNNQIANKD